MTQTDPNDLAHSPAKFTTGLLLIVLGVIFLAEAHGWQFGWRLTFRNLWPLLLIVLGLGRIASGQDAPATSTTGVDIDARRARPRASTFSSGVWFIFLGFLFLLHTNDLVPLWRSWPLFIVWAGLSIMFGRRPAGPGVKARTEQLRAADEVKAAAADVRAAAGDLKSGVVDDKGPVAPPPAGPQP